ncbi:MAG: FHA domain-containing protein [Phycisphaerae bacterium]|nr:FHA domain-containing protein [Phycisphaerae bacterium]
MEVNLVFFNANGHKKTIEMKKAVMTVGRGNSCDIRIPVESCSREHCNIVKDSNALKIVDNGSSNGTFVNNIQVSESELHAGDRITIGPIVLTVQIDGQPADITASEAFASSPVIEGNEELIPTDKSGGSSIEDPISALEALTELHDEK